uniref:Uncharacterized protein n=1 Tax=Anguilla anguilla TaxID=7936 RepID=A0A0E9T715_ANGAN
MTETSLLLPALSSLNHDFLILYLLVKNR